MRRMLWFGIGLVLVGCGCQYQPSGTPRPVRDSHTAPTDDPDGELLDLELGDTPREDGSDAPADRDGDGSPDSEDCAPDDPAIHPGAREQCDRTDHDCDGVRFDIPPGHPSRNSLPEPVAYWPFETYTESNDGTPVLPNDSGNRDVPNATAPGSEARPDLGTGVVGTSAVFHGGEYLVVDHAPPFELSEGTVMFWYRRPRRDHDAGLVSKDSNGRDDGGHLTINHDGRKIEARLQTTDDDTSVRSPVLRHKRWHHVAVSFGSRGLTLYINGRGIRRRAGYTPGLWSFDGETANREPLVIGASSATSDDLSATPVDGEFLGRIDELMIFDRQVHPIDYYAACVSTLAN